MPHSEDYPKNEDDTKNKDDPKNEGDRKNEDDIKNEDNARCHIRPCRAIFASILKNVKHSILSKFL